MHSHSVRLVWAKIGMLFLLLMVLTGCSTFSYYGQAISGHMTFMSRRQPIGELLENRDIDPAFKARLQRLQQVRQFASHELLLPNNGSYKSYAAVDGAAVVWSLVATEAFSLSPYQWCYPIVGCASYRGYFQKAAAESHAAEMEEQGYDVVVEPVPAYSTLGWFDDPIPGNILHWPEWRIAGLVFHELAHQQLYLSGDSSFNEAFANKIQKIGVERWLKREANSGGLRQWRIASGRQQEFIQLILSARNRLQEVYSRPVTDDEKLHLKSLEFARLKREYLVLKASWKGYTGYDHWFEVQLNNARLASIATYEEWRGVFDRILERAHGDLGQFYHQCRSLAQFPIQERRRRMLELLAH